MYTNGNPKMVKSEYLFILIKLKTTYTYSTISLIFADATSFFFCLSSVREIRMLAHNIARHARHVSEYTVCMEDVSPLLSDVILASMAP